MTRTEGAGSARETGETRRLIVEALRRAGAAVRVESDREEGHPDLIVDYRGHPVYVVVKGPGGRLSEAQRRWAERAQVVVNIVRTPAQALALIGAPDREDHGEGQSGAGPTEQAPCPETLVL